MRNVIESTSYNFHVGGAHCEIAEDETSPLEHVVVDLNWESQVAIDGVMSLAGYYCLISTREYIDVMIARIVLFACNINNKQ